MTFEEEFKNLITKIVQDKAYVTNEQATKQSLIIPFINMLGYDASNPLEVQLEYSAGFDKNKEKIDFAIFKDGKVAIFIEAKPVQDFLITHDPQLAKYFNSTPDVRFVILTNGIKYKFYTDLLQPNLIDVSPFYEIDFENVANNDIETLECFSKEKFEVNKLVAFAKQLDEYSKLKPEVVNLLRNPSDELIKLLIKKHVAGAITSNVIERYRIVVQKAIDYAMLEIVKPVVTKGVGNPIGKPGNTTDAVPPNTQSDSSPKHSLVAKTNLPPMKTLFEWSLIKIGDFVYLKNNPQEKAVVLNGKEVEYKGKVLSFNQWGQQVTGWNSICIYDLVIVEGQTETLSVLRQNKMMELGIAKT